MRLTWFSVWKYLKLMRQWNRGRQTDRDQQSNGSDQPCQAHEAARPTCALMENVVRQRRWGG